MASPSMRYNRLIINVMLCRRWMTVLIASHPIDSNTSKQSKRKTIISESKLIRFSFRDEMNDSPNGTLVFDQQNDIVFTQWNDKMKQKLFSMARQQELVGENAVNWIRLKLERWTGRNWDFSIFRRKPSISIRMLLCSCSVLWLRHSELCSVNLIIRTHRCNSRTIWIWSSKRFDHRNYWP